MNRDSILISGAEVRNVSSGNRGAEQLLRTASSRIRDFGYQPLVTTGKVDSGLVSELGLNNYVGNVRLKSLDRFTPRVRLGSYTTIKAVSAVVDASGFAFGDAWGIHTAHWLGRKYQQWRMNDIDVVLLPQAFGPFTGESYRRVAKEALLNANVIYARERSSYEHLVDLGLPSDRCKIAPDITLGEASRDSIIAAESRVPRLVIVPNWNLAVRGSAAKYMDTLVSAVKWARSHGIEPVGLLHEGDRDLQLLQRIAEEAPLEIISNLTGWQTKDYIGKSKIVLSGRYHAVLAALATNTPVVTHSWSHKYEQVLAQFGVSEWMKSPTDSAATNEGLDALVQHGTPEVVGIRLDSLSQEVQTMWSEIAGVLHGNR